MKALKIFFIFVLFLLCWSCKRKETSENFHIPFLKEKAEEIIFMINDKDWEGIRNLSTDEFKQNFDEEFINLNTKIFFEPAGKYLYTKEAYFLETKDKNSGEVIGVIIVKAGYEKKTLCYTFNFAKDTKLIGFFLK
ncbi:DUF3887 domain-containing protein [Treponema putidum]|uniref:DUF3887 domain-containing protein n=1 Tax=Treponema putidum TaxID=221027 RepID=A0AAE9SIM4_9SPIR|nr:DUF3887 domain-containing protein [Treponema putidum]AIN93060.1 hypothetical protein JO40_02085 [Treponema putidum]TWI78537.1 uncharacterized protein DUF3887 [Treponema putidum]UTY29301.1 DUF3887 domain-containing protein [Treponema putidum]UTY31796.1 DUF3887 domain-containing protein [Treponema putidum]UTY34155.1 DUF3887 domain-containing protein [Treponema putidum]